VKENVVVCFDDRIYDLVVQDIESREADEFRDVHVVSFDVKDDHDSAQVGADLALRFCEMCKSAGSLQAEVPSILSQLEDEGQRFTIQYTLLHV
jgi:RNA polymerase II subunit A C-terminal domain phosphatase SSU72